MSELYLVRHAQASFGSDNYDQLSSLGYQQARWLGQHFRQQALGFDSVITGSLQRQQQTATTVLAAMGSSQAVSQDAAFDEFDFQALTRLFCSLTEYPMPSVHDGPRPFFIMMRKAMQAWARDELHQKPREQGADRGMESWQQFHDRLAAGLRRLQAGASGRRILVISSGGAIAMALSQVLQCSVETLIDLNLQARNTGISHLFFNAERLQLSSYNNAPHLDTVTRRHALTYS